MSAAAGTDPRQVLRFNQALLAYAHPLRVEAMLRRFGVGERAAARLLRARRLHPRLSRYLRRRHELGNLTKDALASPAGGIALLSDQAFARLRLAAGAIWHGRSLCRIILRAELREIRPWLEADLHRLAIGSLALAAKSEAPVARDSLRPAIERAGVLCVDAWCAAQAPALGERVRLRLPPLAEGVLPLERAARERGAAIVRYAATRLLPHG